MRRFLIPFTLAGAAATQAPSALCERGAAPWYRGEPATVDALAEVVDGWVRAPLAPADYATGSALFDGEWWFGTYQMAALGFGQVALERPETRAVNLARMRVAIDDAMRRDVWTFDAGEWGDHALDDLAADPHDHAVLGYLGLALGVERQLDPQGPHAAVHDEVIAALSRRVQQRNGLPLATYPGEAYPVDNAAVLAAIGLHARVTGQPAPGWLGEAVATWETRYVQEDGLVVQAVDPATGTARGRARGSGTALSAYFFGFSEPVLARRLGSAARDVLGGTTAGFGAVREYRRGEDGPGDIDSGPLVMGWSVSATGFSLASARRLGDEAWFADLYGTACFFGVPREGEGFMTGGPLGNAILFAMLTARPL